MSQQLQQEIKGVVSNLQSSKVTDRKKGIGQLRDFVNRNRNNLTMLDEKEWSVIIKKAFLECLEAEIKAKASKSSGTLKSEFAVPCKEILTTLIDYSKSDNPEDDNSDNEKTYLLNAKVIKDIIQFILTNINFNDNNNNDDSNRRFCFSAVSCDILKSMLGVRKYSSKITSSLFDELLQSFGDLIIDSTVSMVDAAHYASCVETIILEYPREFSDSQKKVMLALFEDFFLEKSKNCFEKVQLHLITALNYITNTLAFDDIETFRKLANTICSKLLGLFSTNNNEYLKIEILKFFRIVINLRTEETELILENDNLIGLYNILKSSLNQTRYFSYNIKNMSTKETEMKKKNRDIYFEVCADCMNQVLIYESKKSNTMIDTADEDSQHKSPSKRMKIQTVKSEISQNLLTIPAEKEETSNWIKVLYIIMSKYYGRFSSIMEPEFIDRLFMIVKERKIFDEVHTEILKIIRISLLKEEKISWGNNLFNFLIQLVKRESSYVIKEAISLLALILEKVDDNLAYEPEFNLQVLESKYFTSSQHVSIESLHLLTILFKQHITKKKFKIFDDMDSLMKWVCGSLEIGIENNLDMEIVSKFFITILATDGNIQPFKESIATKYLDYRSSLEKFNLLDLFENRDQPGQVSLVNDRPFDGSNLEKFSITLNGLAKNLPRDPKKKTNENFERISKVLEMVHLLTAMTIENRSILSNRLFSKVYTDLHNLVIEFLKDSFKVKEFKTDQWNFIIEKLSVVLVNEKNARYDGVLLTWSLLVEELVLPLIKRAVEGLNFSTKSNDDDFMIDDETPSSKNEDKSVYRNLISRGIEFTGYMLTYNSNIQTKVLEEFKSIFELSTEIFVKFRICSVLAKTGDSNIITHCLEIIPRSIGDNKSWKSVMEILSKMSEFIQDSQITPFSELLSSLLEVYEKNFFDRDSTISLATAAVSASKIAEKYADLETFKTTCKEFLTGEKFLPRFIVSKQVYDWASASMIDSLVDELIETLEHSTDKLKIRTCLLSLSLTTDPTLSKRIVLRLLSCYANPEFKEKELVRMTMSKIAGDDISGFLRSNLRGIILDWVKVKSELSSFPFELFGEKSLGPFLMNNAFDVIPILFAQTDLKTFERICSCINMDLKSILAKYFCYIFPYCLARCFSDRTLIKTIIEEKIRATLGAEVDSLIRKYITDILLETLFLLSENPDNVLTFSFEMISKTLSDLSKNAEKKDVERLLNQDLHKTLTMITNIFELISKKKNEPSRSFYIFKRFVLDVMGANLQVPILLRSVFTVALFCTSTSELFEPSCALIFEVCSRILNSNGTFALTELQLTYPKIRNRLIEIIAKGTTSDIPMKTLMLLVTSQSMSTAITKTEPFPDQEIFKELNVHQQKIQGTENFFAQIGNIISNDHLSTYSFAYVSKLVKNHRVALMKVLAQQDKKSQVLEDYFNKLISKLINACSTESTDEWKELATVTLGNLGLIQNIETSKLIDKSFVDEMDNDPKITNKSPSWLSEIIKQSKAKILLTLNGYITENNVEVVKLALKTLHYILSSSKSIIEKVPDDKKHYFDPFVRADPKYIYIPHIATEPGAEVTLIADNAEETFDTTNKSHEQWLSQVIDFILSKTADPVLGLCKDMCKKKVKFSEMIFILSLLDFATGAQSSKLSKEFSPLIGSVLTNENTKPETIKLIVIALDLLHRHYRFLINQRQIKTKASNYFFSIPASTIAKAAARAEITFSSLMFSELSFEKDNILSFMDQLPIEFEESANDSQKLLLSIYKSIDDPDCIYGATKSYGIQSKILLGEKEGDWTNTLGLYDTSVLEKSTAVIGVLDSLKNMGLDRVSSLILKSIQSEALDNPLVREQFFENRWKTLTLDNLERYSPHSSNFCGFNGTVFNSLYALVKGDASLFKETLSNQRKYISTIINVGNAQSNLAKLQVLSELETAWNLKWTEIGSVALRENEIIDKNLGIFMGTIGIKNDSFTEVETVVNFRASLLRALKKNDLAINHESEFISIARKEGQFTLATNLANRLSSQYPKGSTPPSILEEAKILWSSGDTSGAVHILRFLIQQLEKRKQESSTLYSKACYLLGKWLGESKTDSYENIIRLLQFSKEKASNKAKACYQIGKYIDSLYQNIVRKANSEDSKSYRELMEKNKELYQQYAQKRKELNDKEVSSDFRSKMNHLQKITEWDQKEQVLIQTRQEEFRALVLENYLLASSTSDNYDFLTIPRILNIWFSNATNEKVNQAIYQMIVVGCVPSHKFISLFYQIASRMGYFAEECLFNNVVMHLLFKISKEHPYHTVPLILQIRNADQASKVTPAKSSYKPDQNKINAANTLIAKLKNENKKLIERYANLVDAYIQLAFLQLSDDQKKDQTTSKKLSSQLLITSIKRPEIPILTADIPVCAVSEYNLKDIPFIENFSQNFSLAGGINLPKIISCIATNGQVYRQLVKGNDDMRQDHVIEQLFAIANSLLKKDKETRRRKLLIRTYKVIPTSPTSGILGFVENTQPMATLLIGTNETDYPQSLHGKYRPQDKTNNEVRRSMFALEKKSDATTRIKNFVDVCNNFKPAFHHFFLSQFPNPSDWFEKRQAYTKSVASISMLGYVIGLGDRHLNNILIDQSTGEAVHIDLGICFEQGKYLPIPELVPFRLTRDVIDGFGVSGMEGTFKNSCYATMSVLRNNIEALSLVVEVFLHDPLYRWALSPLEAYAVQKSKKTSYVLESSSSSTKNNRDAERALLRLKEKLLGQEDGELLGVKGQVNKLIIEATAIDKLGLMFSGWSPFL